MSAPKTLVLTGYGINCDYETEFAFNQAGAAAERVHLADLVEGVKSLKDYQILAIPGGFSFGDDLGSGKVLAARLHHQLADQLREFVSGNNLVIGICNGFQVLVNLGLLPAIDGEWKRQVALTFNTSGRFEDRWSPLQGEASSKCIWTKNIPSLYLPVRHGEGRFVTGDEETLNKLKSGGQIALRYAGSEYPLNPNGSVDNIAGICDPSGRIFGLMPHPEAAILPTHHPRWTRGEEGSSGPQQVFRNAVEYFA